MANDYNRNIVENYICHKLSKRGYVWGFNGVPDDDAANNGGLGDHSPTLVRRCRDAGPGPDSDSDPHRLCRRISQSDPYADIHRVLRDAGDELEKLYQLDFVEMSQQLYLTRDTARTRFAEVINELFRDGVNWGRIIAFFEFGSTVCVECASKEEMTSQVDNIAEWMTEYLNGPLDSWIQDNGGWDAFVELYDRQKESVFSCYWPSIKTVFGLAALGAASVTIGAYLAQK
ncbi:apoptosis regulator Bcl-2 [Poecilia latipinna]|uniref:BCL2 apoptosis regulator n=3 Tax=Poecilia TaxID=8080 RepID=A0A087YSS6_POEFO|nr:PREDICTED: apoptosis regulator Bcl-2 [Poecilia formosa]XP_014845875.1 PREDICTED: apoptosis regulator Bcl-2 isoform X1 [Poecilia mexicana]XP_014890686.1 PREDICTED: apoptosis regulator Bcl-2 [Poecilia latipinna]